MVPVENHDNMLPRGGSNSLTVLIDYAIIIASFNTGVPLRRVDTQTFPHMHKTFLAYTVHTD